MGPHIVTGLTCLVILLPGVFGANILGLFPYPGKSHFDFFRPLMLGLTNAGHDVTVVSYFPNKKPVVNYTDIVLDSLPIIANVIDLKQIEQLHFWFRNFRIFHFFLLHNLGMESCTAAFESDGIKKVLRGEKRYDVILVESFVNDCMLAIGYKLNTPVIGLTSHALMPWHYNRMGNPFISSFMPNHFLGHSSTMGFLQRLNNLIHQCALTFLHDVVCNRKTDELIRTHFGESVPPVKELTLNISAVLINQHFSLNGAMPYVPGFVEIGGLHIQNAKPLDPEIKQILDNAKDGVIYVSWGSMVRPETLSEEKKQALFEALSRFNEVVIIKWPNASLPNPPKNFYIRDWMPQRDILCHPNVKVFMTHGGLLGTTEGCYCGVALVVTPFFGDQFVNAAAIEARKAGVVLEYRDFEEKNIVKAIYTALSPEMQDRAKFISEAYRNRPQKPLELAIWWVEYVIQTKGALLAVSPSGRMSWITYFNLDVYAALLLIFLVLARLIKWLISKICTTANPTVKPKSH